MKRKDKDATESYSTLPADKWTRFPVRARPHRNPLSDDVDEHPISPAHVPWKEFYPTLDNAGDVKFVDVGCAYGGLLVSLAPQYPDKQMIGMEIRDKVATFAGGRIKELRAEKKDGHDYSNVWIIRNNVMKYLPNYIPKGQLEKMFFCFPDPHFKKRNHKRRIINSALVPMYAYVMKIGGRVYIISDVEELWKWMDKYLGACCLFKRLDKAVADEDPIVPMIQTRSEDAQRTNRKQLGYHYSVFERVQPTKEEYEKSLAVATEMEEDEPEGGEE
eukprot:TRINITY_DN14068_c0_g1_i1.p1 TRINITY_DN14068_c0_g1~~TRINITY_DN14068_c0_g1_i1.p1  ORF type:complete len:274 (-),score=19.82 TRINITY_DN14068_c0_g1_i1:151-972(-)